MQPGILNHRDEVEDWFQRRLSDLKAEDGWLHLTDRIEIDPGRYRLGRAADNDLVISAGPDHLGLLILRPDGQAMLETEGEEQAFVPQSGAPPRLKHAGLLLEMMSVEGQSALRVRDLGLAARLEFSDIPRFPVDPAWRIVARWEKLVVAQPLRIGLVNGVATSVDLTHRAIFRHDGREIVLVPTHWKSGKPMFVIRDATSGQETYGASRFLIGEVQGDRIILDFNKAHNPPCAFTDLAVCPLPPRENILPFAVRAGEKRLAEET